MKGKILEAIISLMSQRSEELSNMVNMLPAASDENLVVVLAHQTITMQVLDLLNHICQQNEVESVLVDVVSHHPGFFGFSDPFEDSLKHKIRVNSNPKNPGSTTGNSNIKENTGKPGAKPKR